MERSQKARCSGRGGHQGTSRAPPLLSPQRSTMTLRDPSSRRPSKQHYSDAFEWSPNSKGNRRSPNKKLVIHLERIPDKTYKDSTPSDPPQLQHYLTEAESNKNCTSPPNLSPEVDLSEAGPSTPHITHDEAVTDHKSEASRDSLSCDWSDELEELFQEPERVSTGKEQLESVDGVDFLTFETKEDLFEFTAIEMDHIHAPPSIAYEDLSSAIMPTKTHDITKIKGWRTKYFVGNNYNSDYESCVVDVDMMEDKNVSRGSSPVADMPEHIQKLDVKAATQGKKRTRKRKAIKTRFLADVDPPSGLDETWVKFAVSAVVVPGSAENVAMKKKSCKRDSTSQTLLSRADMEEKKKGRPALYPLSRYMRKKMKIVKTPKKKKKKKKKKIVTETDFKINQSVKETVKSIVNSVDRKTRNSKIVPLSDVSKMKTNRELKKLGCVVIDVDTKPRIPQSSKTTECSNDFCKLGCICTSLETLAQPQGHCGKPECMFECTCTETMPTLAVEKLIEDEKRDLAPAEKDFRNAVISGDGGIVMVKQRGRREIKIPGRFRDDNVLIGEALAAVIDNKRVTKSKVKPVKEAESESKYQPRVKKSILQNIQPDPQYEERYVHSPEILQDNRKGNQEMIETAPLFTQQGFISLDKEEQFLASHVKTERLYECDDDCIEIDDMGWQSLEADDEPPKTGTGEEFGKILSISSLDPEEFEKTSTENAEEPLIPGLSGKQRSAARIRAKRLVEFFGSNSIMASLVKSAYEFSPSVLEREAIMFVQWSSLKSRFIEGSISLWFKDLNRDFHVLVSETEEPPLAGCMSLRCFNSNDVSMPMVAREMLQPYSNMTDYQRSCILWCNGKHWEFIGTIIMNLHGQKIMQTMSSNIKPRVVSYNKINKTLPQDKVSTKWYSITLNNDFASLDLKSENLRIPYIKLNQAIACAWRYKKTVLIEISKTTNTEHHFSATFGLYAVPNEFLTVYIGPYDVQEQARLELVPIDGGMCKSKISSIEIEADSSLNAWPEDLSEDIDPTPNVCRLPLVTSKGRTRKIPKHLLDDMEEEEEPKSRKRRTTYEVESIEIPVLVPDNIRSELESDTEFESQKMAVDVENSRTSLGSESEQSDAKKSLIKKREYGLYARLVCSDSSIAPVPIVICPNKCIKYRNPFGKRVVQFENLELAKRFLNYLYKEEQDLTNISWSVCTDVQNDDFYVNLMKSRVRSVNQKELDRTIGPECRLLSRPVRQKWKPHQRKLARKNAVMLLLEECELNSGKKVEVPKGLECTLNDKSPRSYGLHEKEASRVRRDSVHNKPCIKREVLSEKQASHLQGDLLDCSSNSTFNDEEDWLEENLDSPLRTGEHKLAHRDMEKVRRKELATCFRTVAAMLVPPDMLDRCSKIMILLKAQAEVNKVKEIEYEKTQEKRKLEIKRDQLYRKFSLVMDDLDPREKARSVHQLKELLDTVKNSVSCPSWQDTHLMLPDVVEPVPELLPKPTKTVSKRPSLAALKRARKHPGPMRHHISSSPYHTPLPPGVRMVSECPLVHDTLNNSPTKSVVKDKDIEKSDEEESNLNIAEPSMREPLSKRISDPVTSWVRKSSIEPPLMSLSVTQPNPNVKMRQMKTQSMALEGRAVAAGVRISHPSMRVSPRLPNQNIFIPERTNMAQPMVRMPIPQTKVWPKEEVQITEINNGPPPLVRISLPKSDTHIVEGKKGTPPIAKMSMSQITVRPQEELIMKRGTPPKVKMTYPGAMMGPQEDIHFAEIKKVTPVFIRMQQQCDGVTARPESDIIITEVKNASQEKMQQAKVIPDTEVRTAQGILSQDSLSTGEKDSHNTDRKVKNPQSSFKSGPPNVCVKNNDMPSGVRKSTDMYSPFNNRTMLHAAPPGLRMPTANMHKFYPISQTADKSGVESLQGTEQTTKVQICESKETQCDSAQQSQSAELPVKQPVMIRDLASMTGSNLPSHVRITSDAKIHFPTKNPVLLSRKLVMTPHGYGSRSYSFAKVKSHGGIKAEQPKPVTGEITITKEIGNITNSVEVRPAKRVRTTGNAVDLEEITITNERGDIADIPSTAIQDSGEHFEVTITKVQKPEDTPSGSEKKSKILDKDSKEMSIKVTKLLPKLLPKPIPSVTVPVVPQKKRKLKSAKNKDKPLSPRPKSPLTTQTPVSVPNNTTPEEKQNAKLEAGSIFKPIAPKPMLNTQGLAPQLNKKSTDVTKFVINRELMRARLNAVKPKKVDTNQAETAPVAPAIEICSSPHQPTLESSLNVAKEKTSTAAIDPGSITMSVPSQPSSAKESILPDSVIRKAETAPVDICSSPPHQPTQESSLNAANEKTSTAVIYPGNIAMSVPSQPLSAKESILPDSVTGKAETAPVAPVIEICSSTHQPTLESSLNVANEKTSTAVIDPGSITMSVPSQPSSAKESILPDSVTGKAETAPVAPVIKICSSPHQPTLESSLNVANEKTSTAVIGPVSITMSVPSQPSSAKESILPDSVIGKAETAPVAPVIKICSSPHQPTLESSLNVANEKTSTAVIGPGSITMSVPSQPSSAKESILPDSVIGKAETAPVDICSSPPHQPTLESSLNAANEKTSTAVIDSGSITMSVPSQPSSAKESILPDSVIRKAETAPVDICSSPPHQPTLESSLNAANEKTSTAVIDSGSITMSVPSQPSSAKESILPDSVTGKCISTTVEAENIITPGKSDKVQNPKLPASEKISLPGPSQPAIETATLDTKSCSQPASSLA